MSIPPINGSLFLPQVAKIAVMSCLPSAEYGRMSLHDLLFQTCKIPYLSIADSELFLQSWGWAITRLSGLRGVAQQPYSIGKKQVTRPSSHSRGANYTGEVVTCEFREERPCFKS